MKSSVLPTDRPIDCDEDVMVLMLCVKRAVECVGATAAGCNEGNAINLNGDKRRYDVDTIDAALLHYTACEYTACLHSFTASQRYVSIAAMCSVQMTGGV